VKIEQNLYDTISTTMKRSLLTLVFMILPLFSAGRSLDIYFVDVEGGQATLFVSPSGQSLLIDTGWPGQGSRDAKRIAAVAKLAGLKQIDYLVVTHYHIDHAGGVPNLVAEIPVKNFVDHGPSFETDPAGNKLVSEYTVARGKANHLVVKPGDKIPVKGLDITVLTAAGNQIAKALPGAGAANPDCAGAKMREADPSENARSLGTLISYGKFRMIDLGDLTWNKEQALACPANLVGTVDLYLSTHHGLNQSNNPALVHALHPRVAIMNNGARKGGSPEAWQTIHSSPGLQDLWQVHYSVEGATANNVDEQFIANPDEKNDAGNYIKVSAEASGIFTVTNSRNNVSKTYRP
jgi:beta-lactamase superfamily II metal-dependent hydrolase